MMVFTDNISFTDTLLEQHFHWEKISSGSLEIPLRNLSIRLFNNNTMYSTQSSISGNSDYFFITKFARESQYYSMLELTKQNKNLPAKIFCIAGSGENFHGNRNRRWESPPGNIYLTAYFSPKIILEGFASAFLALSAVSVLEVIDSYIELTGKASVKWVNDILIDGAKVAGVLSHCQTTGSILTDVIIGIGLNVETKPESEPTIYVPKAACLNDCLNKESMITFGDTAKRLIQKLIFNYNLIVSNRMQVLLNKYRERSIVVGKHVEIYSDYDSNEKIADGEVERIGENLELYLKGQSKPFINGRLVLV
ncbi:MAG: birA [Ignavibacteria bacterium]|nr:birA [Ignavibacteria bacterium]